MDGGVAVTPVCDIDGTNPAIHYVAVANTDGVPVEQRSRWSCAHPEHLAQAEATVGHGGREYTVTAVDDDPPVTLADRFEAYDKAHPEVYATLRQLAFEWKRRTGRHRLGIAALFERARWELSLQTGESPSLNNDYRSFYARKLMRDEPDLSGMFELRRSAADQWAAAA